MYNIWNKERPVNKTEKKEKENSQSQTTDGYSNAEYVYIIEDQEVWFIDYIIGIAFKTPIDFKLTRIREVI
jgi:hypothetical protein